MYNGGFVRGLNVPRRDMPRCCSRARAAAVYTLVPVQNADELTISVVSRAPARVSPLGNLYYKPRRRGV